MEVHPQIIYIKINKYVQVVLPDRTPRNIRKVSL